MPELTNSLLELLKAALRGQPATPLRLDPEQRNWALRTGMGALLCSGVDDPEPGLRAVEATTEEWPELEAARIEARVRSELLRSTLSEVLRRTTPHLRRPVVLLKGASTALELYPRHDLRPMRDLDLLLHGEDEAGFEESLRALGYRQESPNPDDYYVGHHHRKPFFDAAREVWIELHTDLFPSRDPLARSGVFARKTWEGQLCNSTVEGCPVGRFSLEYQLVHTACHWSEKLEPTGSLPALIDMSLILRRHAESLDWDRVFGWFEDPWVQARAVPVISYLEADGLVELPEGAFARRLRSEVAKLGKTSVGLQHTLIRRFCFGGSPPGRILSENNQAELWAALSRPGSPHSRLTAGVLQVLFPPQNPRRFSPSFQLSRLRNAVFARRD